MTNISRYKEDYLKDLHQFFIFNTEGIIQDTCNSLSDLTEDIGNTNIYDAFPFLESFKLELQNLPIQETLSYECIGMKHKSLEGTYDLFIKRYAQNEFCLVLEDRTQKNEYWQSIQQERNEVIIQKEIIEHQKKVIEYKNKKITNSINYAKRIQEAVLPKPLFFKNLLPESFIVYKPKDIISGDFYWVGEADGKTIFTASDSTGHGVPGALLSMIGASLLNQAVLIKKKSCPADILNGMRDGLINALKQESKDKEEDLDGPFDGMDVALCSLDKNNILEFSGAHNPLVIIRNKEHNKLYTTKDLETNQTIHNTTIKTDQKNLFVLKGERQSIGRQHREMVDFTNHKIQLLKGDTIYIYSDGIQDQFGEETNKKFSRKRLWNLLLDIQDLSMVEQGKSIEQKILSWKGKQEQTDDMCLVAVKIS